MTEEQEKALRRFKMPERLKEERLAKVRKKLERATPKWKQEPALLKAAAFAAGLAAVWFIARQAYA